MKRVGLIGVTVLAGSVAGCASPSASPTAAVAPLSAASATDGLPPTGIDKMYVLDCGQGHAADQARWSAGINVGKPIDISVSCYLIHHATKGYFLWDTGVSDRIADLPQWIPGDGNPATQITWTRKKKLETQLAELKVKPSDIWAIGISHQHPDHIGNTELFPNVPIMIQREEFDSYFATKGIDSPPGDTKPTFVKTHKTIVVDEDLDVFGDMSAMIFYTPGHTPGHQSLLVRLPRTGAVILTADAVHLRTNWENRRIPYFTRQSTEQKLQFLTSMQRIADIAANYRAQVWILHDKVMTDAQKHSPEYYE